MQKYILKTFVATLLLATLLSCGMGVVLAQNPNYDMDYNPNPYPGTGGTYVVSAVSGLRAGREFLSVTFWGASYRGTAWGSTALSHTCWWSGGMPVGFSTNDYGYISYSINGQFSWARSDASRQFTDGNTYWTYSCWSRING